MNKLASIKEIFADKQYDDFTLHYLENFINEFDELFGKHISREELIELIKKNLDHSFEITDLTKIGCSKKTKGAYRGSEKKVFLSNDIIEDDEILKCIIFHEMIHAIRYDGYVIGFSVKYDISDDDDFFLNEKIYTAHGLEEGFVQFLTSIRNAKYNYEYNSYPILTEQIQNLANLVGQDQFIDIGLKNPNALELLLIQKGIVSEAEPYFGEYDYNNFCQDLDVIWKYENEIFEDKLRTILGLTANNSNELLNDAKKRIIIAYTSSFQNNSISDLETMFNQVKIYCGQLNLNSRFDCYEVVHDKLKELLASGISPEEIYTSIDELIESSDNSKANKIKDFKNFVTEKMQIDNFLKLSQKEKLNILNQPNNPIRKYMIEGMFPKENAETIISSLFETELEDCDKINVIFNDLVSYFKLHDLNPNCISMEIAHDVLR